jgi:DDE family transposase
MERELWWELYTELLRFDRCVGVSGEYFSDGAVAATQLWAAVHDRPTSWACDVGNWSALEPPFDLPSQPTMSRRLRTPGVEALLAAVEQKYREADPQSGGGEEARWIQLLDGKPLPVGGHSTDPDSDWGRGVRGDAKGYKLHAVWREAPAPLAWEVAPMSRAEPTVARRLVRRLGEQGAAGYLLADKGYDSNPLHDLAAAQGLQLVAPRKRPGTAWGHRRHSPWRRRSAQLTEGGGAFGAALLHERKRVERRLGNLCGFGGGLQPLPAWVRRRWRVTMWVQSKLLINAARIVLNQRRRRRKRRAA